MVDRVWPPSTFRSQFISEIDSEKSMKKWVRNAETELQWQKLGATWWPITRNETELTSSYVVSPYAALISTHTMHSIAKGNTSSKGIPLEPIELFGFRQKLY